MCWSSCGLGPAVFQPVFRLDRVLGVGSRISADHMRTSVCLPSRTGTCIVGGADTDVIIETEDKL